MAKKKAVKKAIYDTVFKRKIALGSNPYGNGHASRCIADILSTVKIDKKMLQKTIAY